MTVATQTGLEEMAAQRDALADRLFGAVLGLEDVLTIYLGDRLGLYRVLVDGRPATSYTLAAQVHLSLAGDNCRMRGDCPW